MSMFRSELKYAWRNITSHKLYSLINIAGLAISLVAVIFMAVYIRDELSMDWFHKNAENIYRVVDDKETPGVTIRSAQSAAPVAPALMNEFPEVEKAVRIIKTEGLMKYSDKVFEERELFYADQSFFDVFDFRMNDGDKNRTLRDPNTMVITRLMAIKYFGNESPIGKMISLDGKGFQVTGVLNDVPANSHLQFDCLLSMATATQKGSGYDWLFTNWYSNNFHTYIRVPKDYKISKLAASMPAFDERHREAGSTTKHHYAFEKLTEIYLYSDRDDQVGKTGSASNLFIFSAVAVFLLIIAGINFVNLSTARFSLRAKEVGVKKVSGAGRLQIMRQFFGESVLLAAISVGIAIVIVSILMPVFNSFTGKEIRLDFSQPFPALLSITLIITVGLLGGVYPAIVLSGFKPITSLKGGISQGRTGIGFRQALVVFQFAASTILVICTVVVYRQMNYLQSRDLGFKAGQTMVINFEGDRNLLSRLDAIRSELASVPGVLSVTASSNVPGDAKQGGWSMDFAKLNGDTVQTELPIYLVDFNFQKQFEMNVVAGRNLSEEYPMDTVESMLINQSAAKKLGFRNPQEAIGVKVDMYPNGARVVGVLKDFHFEALQKPVTPLAMRMLKNHFRVFSLKIDGASLRTVIAAVEEKWSKLSPGRPIEYSFLDEGFNRQYSAEIKFGNLFAGFAGIAICIACLGLFALALFSVQQRRKEIGIRKVLGAGVPGITLMLSRQFMLLVLAATIIASPLAFLLMQKWLEHFAFRTVISPWIFVAAAASAMLLSLLTVGFHTVRAAIANPVTSLRSE